jgi:hypothetical protein
VRKRYLIGLLAMSSALVSAQTLDGAKVTGLSGQVQVKAAKVWRALQLGEQLARNVVVQLGEGAHLSLRYRSDGHREEAQGPCELTVGNTEGNARVERYGFRNRPLELPRSGGLDAVGGSIANAGHSKSAMRVRSVVESVPMPPPPPPSMAARPRDLSAPLLQEPPNVNVPPPAEPQLALAWQNQDAPILVSSNSDPFTLNAFSGQAVVLDGDTEVGRLPVRPNQPVDFAGLSLHEDTLYLVKLEDSGSLAGTFSFRLLNAEERGELLKLVLQTQVSPEQHQQRMDRFSALGQYHLAAQEGRRWLEEQSTPSPYLLQVVYDLNRDLLRDSRQTRYWKDWATARELPLEL